MQRRQQSHAPPMLLRMLLQALAMALLLDFSLHYLYVTCHAASKQTK